jgi:hypothetical protein
MSEDVRHGFCCVCSPAVGAYPTLFLIHFFNNSNTNEDIATKFEQEYVRCVRNEEECVCSACYVAIFSLVPGLVASGAPCI